MTHRNKLLPILFALLASNTATAAERPPLPASWEAALTTGFPGLPPDARDIAERAAACLHFAGEIGGDNDARDREVQAEMTKLKCATIDEEIKSMQAKYIEDAYIQQALNLVASQS